MQKQVAVRSISLCTFPRNFCEVNRRRGQVFCCIFVTFFRTSILHMHSCSSEKATFRQKTDWMVACACAVHQPHSLVTSLLIISTYILLPSEGFKRASSPLLCTLFAAYSLQSLELNATYITEKCLFASQSSYFCYCWVCLLFILLLIFVEDSFWKWQCYPWEEENFWLSHTTSSCPCIHKFTYTGCHFFKPSFQ